MNTRKESDSVGTLDIPADAYYGVQTLRGYENFQITGVKVNNEFIYNVTLIKRAAAQVNGEYGFVPKATADAIITACDEEGNATLSLRNKFAAGDEIEIVGPDVPAFSLTAPMMADAEGEPLAEPRHPQMVFQMKLPRPVPPLSVVRACRPNS
jgi:hypothetical protein